MIPVLKVATEDRSSRRQCGSRKKKKEHIHHTYALVHIKFKSAKY